MDINNLLSYLSNKYNYVETPRGLGALDYAVSSVSRARFIQNGDFEFEVFTPPSKALDFESVQSCDCAVDLPEAPRLLSLDKSLFLTLCVSQGNARALLSGREKETISFELDFKKVVYSFLQELNRLVILELDAMVGNNPLNAPPSPLPRNISGWDYPNARPDIPGLISFKSEISALNITRHTVISGGLAAYTFSQQQNWFNLIEEPSLNSKVYLVDNDYVSCFVKPVLAFGAFEIRTSQGVTIGARLTQEGCSDDQVRLILGAQYGVFAKKAGLETGVYEYKFI